LQTVTTCVGGATESSTVAVPLKTVAALAGIAAPGPNLILSTHDGSLWQDTNGQVGLQKTARVCITETIENQVILNSTSTVAFVGDTALLA
jgi:hypothetical protein